MFNLIENFPPNISASAIFRVNLNKKSIYNLTVVDSGDNFTLTVSGGLPENSVLEDIGDGNFVFTWNLMEPTSRPLVFVATDFRGASSSFVTRVEVCACVNGGICTLEEVLSANTTVIMNCICDEGERNIMSCM